MIKLDKNNYLFGADSNTLQEKHIITGATFIQGVYYDGIIEDKLRSDLVSCTNDNIPKGIFWVHVNNYENNPAIGFFWDSRRLRGFIVDRHDFNAIVRSNNHFKQASNII